MADDFDTLAVGARDPRKFIVSAHRKASLAKAGGGPLPAPIGISGLIDLRETAAFLSRGMKHPAAERRSGHEA